MDTDKDGVLSEDELYEVLGGCETCSKKYGPRMEQLRHRLKAKYDTPEGAFEAIDKLQAKNGGISLPEFVKAVSELDPPITAEDAKVLFDKIDQDANGGLDVEEFYDEIGGCKTCKDEFPIEPVSVEEAKKRMKAKYKSPKSAFEALDVSEQDGEISLEELQAGGVLLVPKISPDDAKEVFHDLDTDGSGGVDPEEFFKKMGGCDLCSDAFKPSGVTMPIFKERARAKHKTPVETFKAFDDGAGKEIQSSDGALTPEEFENGAVALDPEVPSEDADELFKEFDINGNGIVTPDEFYKVAGGKDQFGPDGVTLPQFKKRAKAKFTDPADAFGMFDTDPKDGKLSPQEFIDGSKQLDPPVGALDASELFKKLDKDSNGNIDESEFNEPMGGCKVCSDEFAPDELTIPEFKKRAKAKHETPQKTFDAFDEGDDGKISKEDFVKGAGALEPPIKVEDAVVLFEKLDKNSDGSVDKDEFFDQTGGCSICNKKFAPRGVTIGELAARLKAKYKTPQGAFNEIKGGDDAISIQELAKAAKELEPPVSAKEIARLFHEIDSDDDDSIKAEEFLEALGGCKTCGDKFLGDPASIAELKKRLRAKNDSPADAFEALDNSPKDGKISLEELAVGAKNLEPPIALADVAKVFSKLDKNNDGGIDASEFNRAMGGCKKCSEAFGVPVTEFRKRVDAKHESPKKALKAFDTDGDGKLSSKELADAGRSLEPPVSSVDSADIFKKLDKDGNGSIDESEFVEGMGGCEDCGEEFLPEKADVQYFAKKTKEKYDSGAETAFEEFDADEDGKISPEELAEGAQNLKPPLSSEMVEELFSKLNKDSDSGVSKEEFFDAMGEVMKPAAGEPIPTGPPIEPLPTVEPVEVGTSPGACRCPTSIDPDEDALIVDKDNGQCSIDQATGMMSVKVIGSKSGMPACMLRPQPPLGAPPKEAGAPWFAQVFKNEIELNPDGEVTNVGSINYVIKEDVFEDRCGRSTAAITCSQAGATKQIVLSTWGVSTQ
jgi:Ca2+-binding EF-hand superfamily protein